MTDFIEHPDHTGSSANPLAPWNRPDEEPPELQCPVCHHEPDVDAGFTEGDECLYHHATEDPCGGHYEIKEHDHGR